MAGPCSSSTKIFLPHTLHSIRDHRRSSQLVNLINRDEGRLRPHFSLVTIELVLLVPLVLLVLRLANGYAHHPPQEEVRVVRGTLALEVEEPGLPHHELVNLGVEICLCDARARLGHQGEDDDLR